MKVAIVLGTRPEIIRLSRVIERLDASCELVLVHTGQNFDPTLSDVFFDELGVRAPDHRLEIEGEGFGARVGAILAATQEVFERERPDRLLVLGDTDSAMSAYVAKRMGIPVLHMEAGNRCFDDRVPEEVNRRIIDQASDVLLPYTERSRENLLREGFHPSRVLTIGNPIKEVLDAHAERIRDSTALADLELRAGEYLLLTLHRQETVDFDDRLEALLAEVADAATGARAPGGLQRPPADPRAARTARARPPAAAAVRPVRLLRLRRARARRPLRAHRQRHGPGGVLHHGRPGGDPARLDRAPGDDRVRQQRALGRRRRRGGRGAELACSRPAQLAPPARVHSPTT